MGLHPQAIMSFCMLVLEMLKRGYKVIISTHSPVVLDVVWALKELRACKEETAIRCLKGMFELTCGVSARTPIWKVLHNALRMKCRAYFFQTHSRPLGLHVQSISTYPRQVEVHIQDISSLDPGDEDERVSGWGGLSGFSGRVADLVGEALREGQR
jgi:hypothetical protein